MLSPLHLSQSQLNLLETCPRRFQHSYLEQLIVPIDADQQARLQQGSQFHLLMQQWQMGLPVEALLQADSQLNQWFQSFLAAAPEILSLAPSDAGEPEPIRQSEHTRTLIFENYLLTVVYDLVLLGDRHARILDWKTYPRPQRVEWLLRNWQTRLYPFVLVETSHYAPEDISMAYWFFQSRSGDSSNPQQVSIPYDARKHEQTRADLHRLLTQLTHWLDRYQLGEPFPPTAQAQPCETCHFTTRCDVTPLALANPRDAAEESEPSIAALSNVADIQEVPL